MQKYSIASLNRFGDNEQRHLGHKEAKLRVPLTFVSQKLWYFLNAMDANVCFKSAAKW